MGSVEALDAAQWLLQMWCYCSPRVGNLRKQNEYTIQDFFFTSTHVPLHNFIILLLAMSARDKLVTTHYTIIFIIINMTSSYPIDITTVSISYCL